MKTSLLSPGRSLCAAILIVLPIMGFSQTPPTAGHRERPVLGEAAQAPDDVPLNPPTAQKPEPRFQPPITGGFVVNTDSREESRQFYNAIYPTSDHVPQGSTAQASSCTPGHNADAFQQAELRRINWFRAMAGEPAAIYLDPVDDWGSQQMAVIISANNALNHNPPSSYGCYNTFAAHYAGGDQALGGDGAEATTLFIWDYGTNNSEVGHRRWILYPPEVVMGVGDVPGVGPNAAGNLTYVFDPLSFVTRPITRQPYVSWPPEGFVPFQVVFPYWSFGLSNADFSGATVTMSSNGVPVTTQIQPYETGFGDNTLVWTPMGLNGGTGGTSFPFSGTDTLYSVTIGNVTNNGEVTSFTYNVTVIDPATSGADYLPAKVNGPAQAAVGMGTPYSITPPQNPHVASYNFLSAQLVSGDLTDDGGDGLVNFTLTPGPNYSPTTTEPFGSGPCFNLEHLDTNSFPQLLQLDEELVPATNAALSFESELGFAFSNEVARVQVSADGGANWRDLYAQPGNGGFEQNFTPHTLSLSHYAGATILLRFNFDFQGGEYEAGGSPLGWYITGIVITNAQALSNIVINNSTATNVVSGDLADSAQNGLTNFTMTPPPYYYVITNPPVGPESACFHLTHLDSTSQLLQFNETLLPTASSSLSFASQLGYATSDETARVQASINNGLSWVDLFVEAGSTNTPESSFTTKTVSLAPYAGQLIWLRFNYAFTGGSYYPQSDNYIGWNIEDIALTNVQQQAVSTMDTTNFTFAPTQTGVFVLQARPVIFSQFPLAFGPITQVAVNPNVPPVIFMGAPLLANGEVLLNFGVSNAFGPTFTLLQADSLGGAWATNATAVLTTNTADASYLFTTTNGAAAQYYRVQSP